MSKPLKKKTLFQVKSLFNCLRGYIASAEKDDVVSSVAGIEQILFVDSILWFSILGSQEICSFEEEWFTFFNLKKSKEPF